MNYQLSIINCQLLEVESRLSQSLHHRVYFPLGQDTDKNKFEIPRQVQLKTGEMSGEPLPNDTPIEEIFDRPEFQGRLLIRGTPGSGKTTLLLQLAKVLGDRSLKHPELPLPILLDISSWLKKKQRIIQWIIANLKRKYFLDSSTAKQLMKNHRVILLLDGLDELEDSQQDKFVEELNQFLQHHWSGSLVVCTGLESDRNDPPLTPLKKGGDRELNHWSESLVVSAGLESDRNDPPLTPLKKGGDNRTSVNINGAIALQPLTEEQVSDYLRQTDCEFLWNQIKDDSNLIQIAQIPLFLNLITLSATEIDVREWQQATNQVEKQSYLWDAYIRTEFKRQSQKTSQKIKHPLSEKETMRCLSWFAQKCLKQKQPFFRLDDSCLDKPLEKFATVSFIALIAGLISGIIFWLMFGTFGFMFGAILGGLIGIIAGTFIESLIPPQPSFYATKQTLTIAGLGSLLSAGICGLISGKIFWPILGQDSGIVYGALFAANGGFIFALLTLFTGGFAPPESRISQQIQQGDRPQENLLKNLVPYFIITLPMGTFWLWVVWVLQGKDFQGWQLFIGGIVIGSLLAIAFGGLAEIHQFSIRLILWLNRRIPWNYPQVLNIAKSCHFVQQVKGVKGGDRFIHPLLSDRFAKHADLPYKVDNLL